MSEEAHNHSTDQEEVDTPSNEEQVAASSVEEKALERGWRPQEEWEGDPDAWVDAKEFLFRGELMDTIQTKSRNEKQLNDEIMTLKESVSEIKDHYSKLAKAEVEKRLKELQSARREAVRVDDLETADDIEDQIEEIKIEKRQIEETEKSSKQQAKASQNALPPEVQDWLVANPWANEDSSDFQQDLAEEALAMLQVEVSRTGDRSTRSLDKVKSKMAKLYPDRFSKERPRTTSTSVDSSSSGRKASSGGKYSRKMDDIQRSVGEKFVQLGTHKNLEEYAKELHDMGELK